MTPPLRQAAKIADLDKRVAALEELVARLLAAVRPATKETGDG